MALTRRRLTAGTAAGLVAAPVVWVAAGPVALVAGPAGGVLFALLFRPAREAATAALVGAAAAVPAWLVVDLTVAPLVVAGEPRWTPAGVRGALPELGLWLVAGVLVGVGTTVAHAVGGGHTTAGDDREEEPTRVVVLGGGFVGLYAARRLEALFGPDESVELTLVSRDNATLFTPMLPEVAGGSLSPTDITVPLRTTLRRTQLVEGEAVDLDTAAREVTVDTRAGPRGVGAGRPGDRPTDTTTLAYDHLVLGLGAVPDDKGVDPDRRFVHDFKSIGDAMRIRNHVVGCFERADATADADERRALTRFVVAGGGFAGVELAGAVNDLAHALLPYYPNVDRADLSVTVVHSGERVLPALGAELAAYARERLAGRGVTFELGVRVDDATPGQVDLSDGRTLRAETLVWTAGNRPHPLVERAGLPEEGGAVAVDETLSVSDREGVWAAGDCAAVRDAATGERHPNTAQHALRAGAAVAANVRAAVTGGEPEPFAYRSQGQLAVIGHQVAVAEVMGRQFAGRLAWLVWRAVYLFKLPGRAQKLRVAAGWLLELVVPRDLVRTVDTVGPDAGADSPQDQRAPESEGATTADGGRPGREGGERR